MNWKRFDTSWMLSLFGTAVGAGILYLPIKAGVGGFWPIVVMSVIIFPMVYLSHRALSRFVAQARGRDKDITHATEDYFGKKIGILISIVYFFAIFPICLAYCVGITNTFESFILNQILPFMDSWEGLKGVAYEVQKIDNKDIYSLVPTFRALLAFVLVSIFMGVMYFSEEVIIKVCEWLVYPLCAVLFLFSLYLIPYWKLDSITYVPDMKDFLMIVWLTLPVLVFAFNHSPAISTFSVSVKKHYEGKFLRKTNQILFNTTLMLLFFVMFFVISCTLALDLNEFAQARAQNIPILSYFANKINNPIIAYGGPLVAFLAITSSFFGHYFGAREGAYGIVRKSATLMGKTPNMPLVKKLCNIVMYVIMIVVAYLNPSVLDFIEKLGGPIIAAILFLMPVISFYIVSRLKKYRNLALDAFVFITGVLTIVTVIYSF
ncbi:HAAAP family serine/threonine permease [Helicobacter valdiviensis]|uniref:HAAAP family serine/threonine permease n=1 Tax=Helicobacter valdiviensis TaxID=1458358 RepID=A0A2W6NKD7_9HELI|nr:aromatic amino acid transport family protein [Helicobacter valdiviensis]PZT47866.1 HAAAP family serine/threonine permease [Helicobacter valdiviensis]